MRFGQSFRTCTALAFVGLRALSPHVVSAQPASTATYDVTMPPGANFDKANFRLWLPGGTAPVQGIVVLTPGSNGDGRDAVLDTVWQAFATKNLALVASQLSDKPRVCGVET